jgi:alkaline phosphatase D
MRGYAELTEASLWLQTEGPAQIRVRYWPAGQPEQSSTSGAVAATEATGWTAQFRLPGLKPGTRYEYELLPGSGPPLRQPDWAFVTQVLWQYRQPPPPFTVALGSCYYANDPISDRPGKPYGRSPEIFERIAEKQPDLMVWLGDNVYYRYPDFGSPAALRERNAKARQEPRLQKLLAGTSHYATWDDHDFGPDNAVWTFARAADAEETFRLYWSNPTYGLPGVRGVFGQFSWADVDFFLLDDRTYRTPEKAADAPRRRMLGVEQMRWLQDALLASEAPFKVIANGSQILNARAPVDTLVRYPAEYRELLDWITSNRIPGVLFVTGDKHHAELIRETPPGFYTLYDFTSSPLTSGMWLDEGEEENPQRVPDTLVLDDANFGLLKFSGPCNDRILTMETWDSKGVLRWGHTVRARDLLPPGTPENRATGHPGCRWLKAPPAN